MNIPCNISPLGWKSLLPAGFTRLEYLQSTGTQYIDTGVPPTGDTKVSVYVEAIAFNYTNYVFGSEHVDGPNMLFSLSYAGANAHAGMYRYDSQIVEIAYGFHSVNVRYFYEFDRNVAYLDGVFRPFRFNNKIELMDFVGTKPLLLFASCHENNNGVMPSGSKRIWSFKIEQSGKRVLDFIPALTPAGEPCMFDLVTRRAFKKNSSADFVAGVSTVPELLTLLRRLPATGGALTLSLPAEANTPEVAEALQACHDTKGWTLTVHEYRPAAAATYSLRRVRSVVWCHCEQTEHGSYAAADGTRWQIERCAAIFGPNGQDPTAYGYTPFDSVEAAAEQWGLHCYSEEEITPSVL